MTIDAVHGVVFGSSKELFSHRNLLDVDTFSAYLADRRPYVALTSSIANGDDALTLDDSTVAAANAALIARRFGHSVTLFVNGYNIASQQPYSFSRLNAALDDARGAGVNYQGKYFDLRTTSSKQQFRRAVKRTLLTIAQEEDRQDLVTNIGRLIGVEDITVPPYLLPITNSDLADLISIGVDIQNHGWTHAGVAALSAESLIHNIRLGREWLQRCGVIADLYAVPNGDGLPSLNSASLWRAWFLLDDSLPIGEIKPGLFNRRTLLI